MSEARNAGSLEWTARYTWGGDEFLFVEVVGGDEPGGELQGHVDGQRGSAPCSWPA